MFALLISYARAERTGLNRGIRHLSYHSLISIFYGVKYVTYKVIDN